MDDFERFVYDLTTELKSGVPLIECSRVELMADKATQTVMVFLRTQASLSAKILAAEEFQYPGLCLVNTMKVVASVIEHLRKRVVAFSANELVQAIVAGAIEKELILLDEATTMFTVPQVQMDSTALLFDWGRVLFDSPYPLYGQESPEGIELYVVHMPDTPRENFSEAEWRHLAKFSTGWNFVRLFGEDHVQKLTALIEYASRNTQVVMTY